MRLGTAHQGFPIELVVALLPVFSSLPLHAQAVSSPTPEQAIQEGLRRQQERQHEQQKALERRGDELIANAAKGAKAEFPEESICFTINQLTLANKDSAGFGWLLSTAQPYLHRCVGVQGLSYIAAELDQRLRDAGYATTRVGLPAQNLQGGVLSIHVEVGRVAAIRMVQAGGAASQPDDQWGTWRNAFPLSTGDILDVRDLEQGVENMKRLPSQNVATRLEPGEAAGTSIVLIERAAAAFKDRLRGGVTLDNSGSPSLGRAQLSANLALDNPAGLNDLVSVGINTNAQQPTGTHRSQSATASYSVPWGYSLLTFNVSKTRFAQYVQGTSVRFLSSGRSDSAETRLQRTIWRDASSKLDAYGSASTRRAASYLDDVEVVVQRRRTTSAEAGINYKHLFETSSATFELGYKRGMPWRGAQQDFASAAQGGLTLRPRIWTFGASYGADFKLAGRPMQYSASLRGQRTRNTTLSIDQISIGGRSSVRGFDGDAVLLAENGVVLRNEVTTPLQLRDGLDSTALFAVDYGRVWGPSDVSLAGKNLAGVALGLRGRMGSRQFEATLATPLYRPAGFRSRSLNFYATFTQAF